LIIIPYDDDMVEVAVDLPVVIEIGYSCLSEMQTLAGQLFW
jgi:hypothetical protein